MKRTASKRFSKMEIISGNNYPPLGISALDFIL